MTAEHFAELARLLAEIVRDGANKPRGFWHDAVAAFKSNFTDMRVLLRMSRPSARPRRSAAPLGTGQPEG